MRICHNRGAKLVYVVFIFLTSVSNYVVWGNKATCSPGEGYVYESIHDDMNWAYTKNGDENLIHKYDDVDGSLIFPDGTCVEYIKKAEECEEAASHNSLPYKVDYLDDPMAARKKESLEFNYSYSPGCLFDRKNKYFWFNKDQDNFINIVKCGSRKAGSSGEEEKGGYSCVCRETTCKTCPKNTFSKDGKCVNCPDEKKYTKDVGMESEDGCLANDPASICEKGKGFIVETKESQGNCGSTITTRKDCESAAQLYYHDKEIPYKTIKGKKREDLPYGCIREIAEDEIFFNTNTKTEISCGEHKESTTATLYECLCKTSDCRTCPKNTYKSEEGNEFCRLCPKDKTTNFKEGMTSEKSCVDVIKKDCLKEKGLFHSSNGGDGIHKKEECLPLLHPENIRKWIVHYKNQITDNRKSIRYIRNFQEIIMGTISRSDPARMLLQREFANLETQIMFNKITQMKHIKDFKDNFCDDNEHKDIVDRPTAFVFPAVRMNEEDDGINCINHNRNSIVNAYCNFRKEFDETLRQYNVKTTSKKLWPRICCASLNDDCNPTNVPTSDKTDQFEMIPFAMSQESTNGTNRNETLWKEVFELLRGNLTSAEGIIYNGMKMAVDKASEVDDADKSNKFTNEKERLEQRLKEMFKGIDLCGPRVFKLPRDNGQQMCQLFYSYRHMFASFNMHFKDLFNNRIKRRRLLTQSFLRTNSLRARYRPMNNGVKPNENSLMSQAFYNTMHLFYNLTSMKSKTQQQEMQQIKKLQKKMTMKSDRQQQEIKKLQNQITLVDSQGQKLQLLTKKVELATEEQPQEKKIQLLTQKVELATGEQPQCSFLDNSVGYHNTEDLEKYKNTFCRRYNLDMSGDPMTENMIIMPLEDKFGTKSKKFDRALVKNAKFRVGDGCKNPMFDANDISLQQLDGKLYMIIQFKRDSGYLKTKINSYCEELKYIPKNEIGLQIFADTDECCKGTKDERQCLEGNCRVSPLKKNVNITNVNIKEPIAFKLVARGNDFKFDNDRYLLEGTKFTKPTFTNYVKVGENVNKKNKESNNANNVLLEIKNDDFSITEINLKEFQKSVKPSDSNDKCPEDIFKGVFKTSETGFDLGFNCLTTKGKALCDCITAIGTANGKKSSIKFTTEKFEVEFIGRDSLLEYTVKDLAMDTTRRRRLLGHRRGGC
jgi:hypothetical protein